MLDIIREAPLGQVIRAITKGKFLRYPEEKPDFQCPHAYRESSDGSEVSSNSPHKAESNMLEKEATSDKDLEADGPLTLKRTQTQAWTNERLEVEMQLAAERTVTKPIIPTKTSDGVTLVDWYTTDDPANPQNWSQKKKAFVALQVDLYTFAVYTSSSLYVAGELGIMAQLGADNTEASLGLALYVLGYGCGPLIWSPMSEIATIGRNVPYVATFAIFVILAVPTALATNLPGLLFLRFLQGFFGSPCLANGGATMQDMYSLLYLPYAIAFWVSSAFAAPALGPTLAGFAVSANGWRWSLWEILWASGPIFLLWFAFLPETLAENILLRRAKRLRRLYGNQKIRSQSEIDLAGQSTKAIFFNAIIKPFEIMVKDPAVLYTNVYTAITYGIYYGFFEVFPLIYPPLYGFNLGETGLAFLCIVIGCACGMVIFFTYLHFFLIPDVIKNGLRAQEWRLRPALPAIMVYTCSLFAYGWTARSDVHWIVGQIMLVFNTSSIYIVLLCIFVYIPMSYPRYAASLFASNDFCRASFAFASVLFSRDMYLVLGIGKGLSVLGGLSVIGIIGMWVLYFYGAKLRARSKFAI